MNLILASLAVLLAGSTLCLLVPPGGKRAGILGPAIAVLGSVLGIVPALDAMVGAATWQASLPWVIPAGSLAVGMDALSGFFAFVILTVSALAAVYGHAYLSRTGTARRVSASWFMFNVLVGSMLLVVVARNAVLFLLAWELMSLASFFLVMFDGEKREVRRAGWIYLAATHFGTAFLLVLFGLLGIRSGTFDFSGFSALRPEPVFAGAAFILAVIGFGTKAGLVPLHVWLPEAHPAAPSHVSAVMSGVMIKTGIYGLLRFSTFLGAPMPWWGWTLMGAGVLSGLLGILSALAQRDMKRLLAFSSVENMGIVAMGLGFGFLGISRGSFALAFLGFAGALMHVFNHAVFKSLLFMGAGSVLHAAGTVQLDRLGGLSKSMPVTACAFMVGAAAICGLPPLNGFLGEFLLYRASLGAIAGSGAFAGMEGAGLVLLVSLAMVGGLAVACFTKVMGVVFLGEPRDGTAAQAHECPMAMRLPMMVLAAICLLAGISAVLLPGFVEPAVRCVVSGPDAVALAALSLPEGVFSWTAGAGATVLLAAAALYLLRNALLSRRRVDSAVTWDCGYAAPASRMQYTSSSFSAPIVRQFHAVVRTDTTATRLSGLFPSGASFSSEARDVWREHFYAPLFKLFTAMSARARGLQHGRLNLYILYIVLALVALLAWKLR
ncbi:MAG: hypothetical protein FJ224_02760 [Lentisphaerae bacterium]|nr:hypothetical protein [Lentisphaerota bacterium]